jgi:hypothetical protein
MKPLQPTPTLDQHTMNTNLAKVLTGNVSPGNGLTFDTNGQPLTYSTDNQSGILIRIGATGNPFGAPYSWPASNTNLTIAHNLNKIPYGFHLVSKNKACDVFQGTILPTAMNITLQCTDATADTTVFIMV